MSDKWAGLVMPPIPRRKVSLMCAFVALPFLVLWFPVVLFVCFLQWQFLALKGKWNTTMTMCSWASLKFGLPVAMYLFTFHIVCHGHSVYGVFWHVTNGPSSSSWLCCRITSWRSRMWSDDLSRITWSTGSCRMLGRASHHNRFVPVLVQSVCSWEGW